MQVYRMHFIYECIYENSKFLVTNIQKDSSKYVCLYVCMSEWMDVCMDGWNNERTHAHSHTRA